MTAQNNVILDVQHIGVDYFSRSGTVHAVSDVSFSVNRGEIFGLAGESGSGKSTLAFAVARLLKFPAEITGGQALFYPKTDAAQTEPIDILQLNKKQLRDFRWKKLSIVFQSAMNALNPVLNVQTQIIDTIRSHQPHLHRDEYYQRAVDLVKMVGIAPERLKSFPHQLSGGMRQRVVIAIALALNPELIIMDEPTTALDVVVQREILSEIQNLKKTFGFSVVFITHDLSLLTEICDHLAIMYAGKIVEQSNRVAIMQNTQHPYTFGLLHSFPSLYGEKKQILGIPGHPPDLRNVPTGCAFNPRCSFAVEACRSVIPTLQHVDASAADHLTACHLYDPRFQPNGPPKSLGRQVANDDPQAIGTDMLAGGQ